MPAPRKDVPTYNSFHHRLRHSRGRAAEQICSADGCEAQAAAWSWDHTGPFVVGMNGARSCRYSLDESRYDPLCRQHHALRDALPRQTVCGRGHEMTLENTYVDPRGRATCRRCALLRTHRARGKLA